MGSAWNGRKIWDRIAKRLPINGGKSGDLSRHGPYSPIAIPARTDPPGLRRNTIALAILSVIVSNLIASLARRIGQVITRALDSSTYDESPTLAKE